jgi:hypothetical protein
VAEPVTRSVTPLTHGRAQGDHISQFPGSSCAHGQHGVNLTDAPVSRTLANNIAKTQDGQGRRQPQARPGRDRTPFEVLDDFRWTGDSDDLVVWREYERATKGRQAITLSKEWRAALAADDV